jgi:hypothetical protein
VPYADAMISATPTPTPSDTVGSSSATNLSEWLDFWGVIVSSLAWPAAVLTLLVVFRKPLTKLADGLAKRASHLRRISFPGGEAEWFDSAVEEIAEEVESSEHEPRASAEPSSATQVPLALARVQPSAGVIGAFLEVEQAINRYLAQREVPIVRRSPVSAFRRDANVPPNIRSMVSELAELRNAAAHGYTDISYESAESYIRSAISVAHEIDLLTSID